MIDKAQASLFNFSLKGTIFYVPTTHINTFIEFVYLCNKINHLQDIENVEAYDMYKTVTNIIDGYDYRFVPFTVNEELDKLCDLLLVPTSCIAEITYSMFRIAYDILVVPCTGMYTIYRYDETLEIVGYSNIS